MKNGMQERRGHWRRAMKRISLIGILAISLTSCVVRDYATSSRADVILRILAVTGTSGLNGTEASVLFSDVLTEGGVVNDSATVELEAIPKNPLFGDDLPNANDVILQSYTVEYLRSDGRNVQGVDVPFSISGSLSIQVDIGGTTSIPFTVVRHQAKLEPPLRNMAKDGSEVVERLGSIFITTTAKITIYGKTTSGKDVSTVCYLEITFGDFADA
jgi:hypothetical protein